MSLVNLHEDLSTAEKDIKVSKSQGAKLLQELSEKDSVIRGLCMSHRVLEKEFLQFEKIFSVSATEYFRYGSDTVCVGSVYDKCL